MAKIVNLFCSASPPSTSFFSLFCAWLRATVSSSHRPVATMFNPRRWLLLVFPILTLCLLYYLSWTPEAPPVAGHAAEQWTQHRDNSHQEPPPLEHAVESSEEYQCGRLGRDMDDVFVVLKTGATEALDKVPLYLRTMLHCVPHFAIFSDYEETINGVRTYDILRNVSETAMQNAPEFGFYRRLQEVGREGLTEEEWGDNENGPFGKTNNPGWKLDKWKFLPMIDTALEIRPDAKWYIFLEADTYMVWPNLVNWLARFDHTLLHYLGSPMQIGEHLFAYGGAGIILSNRAMQRLHSYRARSGLDLERMTSEEWAGDCVLGRALHDVHIPLTWAWPMMLTSRPWELDHFSEAYGRQPWCHPVISYHHMDAKDMEEMWRFDRAWFGNVSGANVGPFVLQGKY